MWCLSVYMQHGSVVLRQVVRAAAFQVRCVLRSVRIEMLWCEYGPSPRPQACTHPAPRLRCGPRTYRARQRR
jgi:hypothetical protein